MSRSFFLPRTCPIFLLTDLATTRRAAPFTTLLDPFPFFFRRPHLLYVLYCVLSRLLRHDVMARHT